MGLDGGDLTIGGILVLAVVFGMTQAIKDIAGLEGNKVKLLALFLGFVFVGVAQAVKQELFPTSWTPYVEWVFNSLAGALSAVGYYDWAKEKVLPALARR